MRMRRLTKIVLLLCTAAVAGMVVFLATWDIPPPITTIETVIPNDRFPR